MLELRDWDVTNNDEVSLIERIYTESFPHSERRRFDLMMSLYNDISKFHVQVAIRKSQVIGFITSWDLDSFIFAEHFAIDSQVRNGGLGGFIMKLFISEQAKPIVLEVELPTTNLSDRRIGFYQRLGYRLWDKCVYQQPAYHEDGLPITMYLMTLGDINLDTQYSIVKEEIYSCVYNC